MEKRRFWKFEHYSTLSSTNDYCIEIARLGNKTDLAVLADSQSSPRGSRGRKWIEPQGNLAFSLLYWPRSSNIKLNWIPFVAALSLYDAVRFYSKVDHELFIKWPNDLLYKNRKIGGILIESNISKTSHLEWLVMGFGVNINSYPDLNRKLGCLKDFVTKPPLAKELSKKIIYYFDYWINFLTNDQEKIIREAWIEKSIPLNSKLTVNLQQNSWEGIYCGIDEHGLLLLQTVKEMRSFSTGEVFWLDNSQDC